jgi:hypothetical protein
MLGPAPVDGDQRAAAPAAGPVAAARPAGEITLPKVRRAPVRIEHEPGRNETVTVRKGPETREMKWKKAEKLVKEEGWMLVNRG